MYFLLGKCSLELARRPSHVALAWHFAGSSIPFGVTVITTDGRTAVHCCASAAAFHRQDAKAMSARRSASDELVPVSWLVITAFTS